MLKAIVARTLFLRNFAGILVHNLLARLWALLGTIDLALSQVVPKEYAEKVPKFSEFVAMMIGLESWQFWLVSGSLVVAGVAVETAYRFSTEIDNLRRADDKENGELLAILNDLFKRARKIMEIELREDYTEEQWYDDSGVFLESARSRLAGLITEAEISVRLERS